MTETSAPLKASDVEDKARAAAAAALSDGESAAARAAIAVAESILAGLEGNADVAAALAGAQCRAGCSWCCHQVVGITTAEEAMLAEAVAALPAEARSRIHAHQRQASCRLSGLPVEKWQAARVPCPLLDDGGLCSIHPSRPLPCRAVLSADADSCRAWLEGGDAPIPLVALPRRVYSLAQAGLAQALAAAGIPPGPVSLTEALDMMLG